MTDKEIKGEIIEIFFTRLREIGFDKFKKSEGFKSFEGGSFSADIHFWKKFGLLEFSCNIAARLDVLEDLINDFKFEVLNQKKTKSYTIGGNIGNIKNGVFYTWSVYNSSEIEENVTEMLGLFDLVAVPFFERYTTAQVIYDGLTVYKTGNLMTFCMEDWFMRVLALTYILNRHDLFVLQITNLEKKLVQNPQADLDEFRTFQNWLDNKFMK
jgi:hypothetical protein